MAENHDKCLLKDGRIIVERLIVAERMFARMKGLLGRSGLARGNAMLLRPCSSIHTFGMRFSLDLIFVDADLHVVRIVKDIRPNRMVMGGRGAKSAIEIESGWFDFRQIDVGDTLVVAAVQTD